MKEKVYIIHFIERADWQIFSEDMFIFKNKDNARTKFNRLAQELEQHKNNYDTFDKEENCVNLYDAGWSDKNELLLTLTEREFED